MAVTEYILTDADVGFTFPEVDGFLSSLVRSRGPFQNVHAMNIWERHFVLRDATPRPLYCLDAVNLAAFRFGLAALCILPSTPRLGFSAS
jgi:hypothetical protein